MYHSGGRDLRFLYVDEQGLSPSSLHHNALFVQDLSSIVDLISSQEPVFHTDNWHLVLEQTHSSQPLLALVLLELLLGSWCLGGVRDPEPFRLSVLFSDPQQLTSISVTIEFADIFKNFL